MSERKLWVVEIKIAGAWRPTFLIDNTRAKARETQNRAKWRYRATRVRCYVPQEEKP